MREKSRPPQDHERVRIGSDVVSPRRSAPGAGARLPSGFLRSSACAMPKTAGSRQEFSGRRTAPAASFRQVAPTSFDFRIAMRVQSRACRGTPKTRHFSFSRTTRRMCDVLAPRVPGAWSRRAGGLAAPGGAMEIRRGLLTVEKTVIRFRPKQTVPARTSEPNQREKRQHETDLRPDDRQGGWLRFLRENAPTPEYPNPQRQPPRVF